MGLQMGFEILIGILHHENIGSFSYPTFDCLELAIRNNQGFIHGIEPLSHLLGDIPRCAQLEIAGRSKSSYADCGIVPSDSGDFRSHNYMVAGLFRRKALKMKTNTVMIQSNEGILLIQT